MTGHRRWVALALVLSLPACGRVYSGEVVPRGDSPGYIDEVRVQRAPADSLDLFLSVGHEADEHLFGCYISRFDGARVLDERRTAWGGQGFTLRVPAEPDSELGVFVVVPEDVALAWYSRTALSAQTLVPDSVSDDELARGRDHLLGQACEALSSPDIEAGREIVEFYGDSVATSSRSSATVLAPIAGLAVVLFLVAAGG